MASISIIGGGITGLTCAYKLVNSGHRVTVYEKTSASGGLAASFRSDGFYFDYGPHEFCTENDTLIHLLEDVLEDNLLVRHKKAAQFFNNAYIDYPISPVGIIRQLDPFLTARIGAEVFAQRLRSLVYEYSDHSFERWVNSRFGPTLYNTYFKPYTEKVWGIDPDQLDSRTASNRIAFNSVFDYLLKSVSYFVFKRNDFDSIHSPLKDKFFYCKNGIGTLTTSLLQKCLKSGVEFVNDCSLKEIEVIDGRATTLHFENGRTVEKSDYVISTIPLTTMLSCIGEKTQNLPIRFRSMIFVFMELPKSEISPYSWVYFPDKDICFQRLTDFGHFDAEMSPSGKTGICLEISCFSDDPIWSATDAEIINNVRVGLNKAGLLPFEEKSKAHVKRREYIYPIQIMGYEEIVSNLLDPVRSLKNFVTTGRQGLYKYCNMNECMEMALSVAEQIDSGTNSFEYNLRSTWKGAGVTQPANGE